VIEIAAGDEKIALIRQHRKGGIPLGELGVDPDVYASWEALLFSERGADIIFGAPASRRQILRVADLKATVERKKQVIARIKNEIRSLREDQDGEGSNERG